jgi:transposase InsO family protein
LISHSDRVSQYASYDFQKGLWKNGMRSLMSRKGEYWDNPFVESFFSTLKTELIYQNNYKNQEDCENEIKLSKLFV